MKDWADEVMAEPQRSLEKFYSEPGVQGLSQLERLCACWRSLRRKAEPVH